MDDGRTSKQMGKWIGDDVFADEFGDKWIGIEVLLRLNRLREMRMEAVDIHMKLGLRSLVER
jgi:hypothetical protein